MSVHYQQAGGVTAERSGDRVVLLDASGTTLFTLSPVGSLIWEWLPADTGTILARLAETFPAVTQEVLASDASRFLDQLGEEGLVGETDAAG